jgi:hypothetical protein
LFFRNPDIITFFWKVFTHLPHPLPYFPPSFEWIISPHAFWSAWISHLCLHLYRSLFKLYCRNLFLVLFSN